MLTSFDNKKVYIFLSFFLKLKVKMSCYVQHYLIRTSLMFALFGFAISDRSCPTFPENKDNDLTARRGNVKI